MIKDLLKKTNRNCCLLLVIQIYKYHVLHPKEGDKRRQNDLVSVDNWLNDLYFLIVSTESFFSFFLFFLILRSYLICFVLIVLVGLECEIDIQKTVQHVRSQRPNMVQLEVRFSNDIRSIVLQFLFMIFLICFCDRCNFLFQ